MCRVVWLWMRTAGCQLLSTPCSADTWSVWSGVEQKGVTDMAAACWRGAHAWEFVNMCVLNSMMAAALRRILTQDKAMVEQLRPDMLLREISVKADLPQMAFRKLRQEYIAMGYGEAPGASMPLAKQCLTAVPSQWLHSLSCELQLLPVVPCMLL